MNLKERFQLQSTITDLVNRQKDIEFMLKSPHKHYDDPEWVAWINEIKAEYHANAGRIGSLESTFKMSKLEAL